MELYDQARHPAIRPVRSFPTRHVFALLIAVVAATVAAAGIARAMTKPTRIGTGAVVIETNLAYQGARAAGTGMVLTPSGEVLTNNHVIRGATSIRIRVPGTAHSYRATVVGYSVSNDVAILQAAGVTNLKPISLGSSDTVGNGDSVRALGNAGGTGRLIPASGNVTGLGRSITVSDDQGGSESLRGLIETNAAIRPGDSGGPLLNAAGQVIGMDTAASVGNGVDQTTANQGYAIPIDRALSIAHQIENGESSASVHVGGTAFIGVEATGDSYGDPGASVTGVVPGGPAEAAGLAPGDLITAIGGRMISSPDELSAIVLDQKPGASISTTYLDTEGATRTANLRLTTGPPR